ncbi:uncharacterized protein FOMMEDRAFT_153663 [Fomitiporia mediterranea MF3/22]|uniref:uncharacterized protein n=1 Tax=Fomitiporia mediterranea (strain MF3/22) TaxID=694068 RepID=UPI0004408CF8|nr:uncharacterized protein FOMMEDRAFT_153663 [Fomitiporia mediterranea MF3/22]EJD06259.1 hypothetical protein FOMMEDRAFT_153663 [Fomitiporia mediterranea MF3/22]
MLAESTLAPWQLSASQSSFTIVTHAASEHRAPCSDVDSSIKKRNMLACARCADSRKKCNMSPPYSSDKCEGCTRAGVAVCPPHRPRKNGHSNFTLLLKQPINPIQTGASTSSVPDQSVPQSSAMNGATHYQQMTGLFNGEQVIGGKQLELPLPFNPTSDTCMLPLSTNTNGSYAYPVETELSTSDDWEQLWLSITNDYSEFDCWVCRTGLPCVHNGQLSTGEL